MSVGRARAVHVGFQWLCGIALVVAIGGRLVRYATASPPEPLDHLLGGLMVLEEQTFLWGWAYSQVAVYLASVLGGALPAALRWGLLLALAAGAAWILRGRLLRREDGLWRATPLGASAAIAVALAANVFLDANPFVALVCASSFPLVLLAWRTAPGAGVLAAGAALFAAGWALLARDPADALTAVLWTGAAVLAARVLPRWLGRAEVCWLLLLAVLPANLLPALLPLALPLHGGTKLGDGLAYHFCEVPGTGRLLASVPGCDSIALPGACDDGVIAVYDAKTLERIDTYRFFSDEFSGRLEKLVCLEDEVLVAVQSTRYRGKDQGQTALSFPVGSPGAFTPLVGGPGLGSNVVYDPSADALFFVGEFTHRIARRDRRTGALLVRDDEGLARPWLHPVELRQVTASFGATVVPELGRLYVYEFHRGRSVYALDPATLETLDTIAVNSGGGWGVTGDPERGRLLLSSLWGVERVDAASDEVTLRRRLGLGTKQAVLDAARDRFYVSSSLDGKIRVLDRDSLSVLASIPVGLGTRHLTLSEDGRRLYGSSSRAHYAWDLEEGLP